MSQPDIPLKDAALMLDLGPRKVFQTLRDRNVLTKENMPYRRYCDQGLFTTRLKGCETPAGTKTYAVTHVTQKGLRWLAELFDVEITEVQQANPQAKQTA